MSWLNLNQSLNSLKGQITNFASEVLLDGVNEENADSSAQEGSYLKDLEEKCRIQELEIATLKQQNEELSAARPESNSKRNGVRDEDSSWYWDPQPTVDIRQNIETKPNLQIQALQEELSALRERCNSDAKPESEEEIHRLREENKNLTNNLEDLDSQHQLAMERLLSLKKELQKNFELLKQEHEELKSSNDEYAQENKSILKKLEERDRDLESLQSIKHESETIHGKYLNLERVYSLLKENAEKFQEENQDLHEEVFKLQEKVTSLEHDLELATKPTLMVSKEKYDELLEELNHYKQEKNTITGVHMDEINIDDNAKSVIENLKRELNELRNKISQKQSLDSQTVKADKIMHLYSKYVNFELPVDYVGEISTTEDGIVLYKLETAFKTLNSFKKQIDAYDLKLSEKTLNIKNLQTQIDELTTENDFLTTDLQHFERELNEMKKNNDFLISEITALKNTSKLEPIIETHEDNLVKLETELADCTRMNKTFESEIKRVEKELSTVTSEKTTLQESLSDLKQKYTSMLNELDECKNQTKALEDLELSANNETVIKLNNATFEIDDLKKNLATALSKNEQMSIDIHIIENDKVLLTKKLDDLQHELKIRQVEHNDLETIKIMLDSKLHDLENKIDEVIKKTTGMETTHLDIEQKVSIIEDNIATNITKAENISENLSNISINTTSSDNVTEIHDLRSKCDKLSEKNTLLHKTIDEMSSKIVHEEVLSNEIISLKSENEKLLKKTLQQQAELTSTDSKIVQLEQEFDKLIADFNGKDVIIDNLNAKIAQITNESINIQQNLKNLEETINLKNEEVQKLNQSLLELSEKMKTADQNSTSMLEEIERLSAEKGDLSKQIFKLNDEISSKNSDIQTMHGQLERLEKLNLESKISIESKEKEIKELNQSIVEMEDKIGSTDNTTHQNDEYAKLSHEKEMLQMEVSDLKRVILEREKEISETKSNCETIQTTCLEFKAQIDKAATEKGELINLINVKHNESIQYHNEIQRLNHVLLEQTNELKRIIEENNHVTHNNEIVEGLNTTLMEKDDIIKSLNNKLIEYEKNHKELLKANETIRNITEQCENLDKNLQLQLKAVQALTAENAQLTEAEQSLSREVGRLRQHLLETEEQYTAELVAAERRAADSAARLQQVEARANHSSTLYTSNSIRANQEVETLRNQIRLLEKQREEAAARLGEAEDARGRSDAALLNLQVVLEQFQLDKERDIHAATEKIRNKMNELKLENEARLQEVAALNSKLEESLAGLQAAARLGDQVETKTAQINDLKEQIRRLRDEAETAARRQLELSGQQQDRVDKHLVKNLLLNYVTAAQNNANRWQVLRVLSTVLDFNQQECERAGLARGGAARGSGGGGGGAGTLAAEFVRFLHAESTPRPAPHPAPQHAPRPAPLAEGPSALSGRHTPVSAPAHYTVPHNFEVGHSRNASTGSNNLLFQNLDLEQSPTTLDTGVTQTRNTEGSILKNVLRDM